MGSHVALTDRRDGIGIACALEESSARTIVAEPRIITPRPLDAQSRSSRGHVIDLNQNPIEFEEAIEIWSRRAHPGEPGTVIIHELARKKLFAEPGADAKGVGPT